MENENKETYTLNIYERLSLIMREAGTISKTGYNDHSRYKYVKAADVAKKFQELLLAYNVFVTASVEEVIHTRTKTAGGKDSMYVCTKVRYTFTNTDNPSDQFSVVIPGDGMDTGDKGVYKALTGSQKYLFSLNFCMGSEDDAEVESPELKSYDTNGTSTDSFNF